MRFRTLLAGLGGDRTVILSTHILDDIAQTCPYVFVLRQGRIRYDGPTEHLTGHAAGRVWLTQPSNTPPPAGMIVANAVTTARGVCYRVITDTPPADAHPMDPTLEDGYMVLIEEHPDQH